MLFVIDAEGTFTTESSKETPYRLFFTEKVDYEYQRLEVMIGTEDVWPPSPGGSFHTKSASSELTLQQLLTLALTPTTTN